MLRSSRCELAVSATLSFPVHTVCRACFLLPTYCCIDGGGRTCFRSIADPGSYVVGHKLEYPPRRITLGRGSEGATALSNLFLAEQARRQGSQL